MTAEKKVLYTLAAGCLFVGFLYVFSVTFVPIPTTGVDHAKVALGFVLGTVVGGIVMYFWGSSKGSTDKNEMLAGKTPPQP